MVQHVMLKVAPEYINRSVEPRELLGFELFDAPATLTETFAWIERAIRLECDQAPNVWRQGHAAIVVEGSK